MIYYYILFVILGVSIGFSLSRLFGRQKKYVGNIVVTEKNGITLYSLELNDNPEKIKFEKEAAFKVVIPDEESDRE